VAAWFALKQREDQPAITAAATSYSVAVLPFVDLSPAQDQEHFSDGISDEILYRLNQSPTLKVIARPSSFSFKGQGTSIPEIAAKLHVTHVLEGSVRKSGNRVRLTVRLAEAASNSQVWSETYDYELGDIFKIQEEVAGQVATALDARLAGGPAHVPKEAAIEPFLRAEFFYNRRAAGDIVRAVKYYQKALSIDPEYARAWASLSGAYALLAFGGDMNREEALTKQGEAARKAVALDPDLAVGYARLGQYYWDIGDRESGYRTLDRAIALDPNDLLVLTFLAGIAMRNGDVAGAISRYDRIVARDPRSAAHHANRGIFLQAAGRFDEAKVELETAKEFNSDLAPEIDLTIARILIVQDRLDEASTLIARLPEGEVGRDHGLALLYYAQGRHTEADAALNRLVARSGPPVDIRLAEIYAFRGMADRAFATLQGLKNAVDRNAPSEASLLWSWQVELRVSPFMAPLHDDPRWQTLMVEPRSVSS
jgi:TolB-like protein/Flp pilus assembly protein TadD